MEVTELTAYIDSNEKETRTHGKEEESSPEKEESS